MWYNNFNYILVYIWSDDAIIAWFYHKIIIGASAMIQVNQYIKTAFSAEDAANLLKEIQPLVDAGEKIVLDFSEIKLFTTLFFNNALAKYVLEMGPEAYSHRFEVKNLSEVGETTYLHSMENAKDYYRGSAEEKEQQQKLLADFDE